MKEHGREEDHGRVEVQHGRHARVEEEQDRQKREPATGQPSDGSASGGEQAVRRGECADDEQT